MTARRLRLPPALFLAAAGAPALAGGMIEFDPRFEDFGSRSECETALKGRHKAALSQVAASSKPQSRKVHPLVRDRDRNLTYVEELDPAAADVETMLGQTESFTCRGGRLEHRIEPQEAPKP